MRQVPSGLLSDTEIPVQLHAGDPLETGAKQKVRNSPSSKGELRAVHQRTGLDGEVLSTGPTVVRLWLSILAPPSVQTTAEGADDAVRPARLYKPSLRFGLI